MGTTRQGRLQLLHTLSADARFKDSVATLPLSLVQVVRLFEADPAIGTRKQLYVRLGCRGDWPVLAAPGWVPPTGTAAAPGSEH